MSIKLSDTQLVMLSAAAQREDRCIAARPNLNGASAAKIATKLVSSGLAKEIKAKPGAYVWRRDSETGQAYALKLTAAGLNAIAVDEDSETETGVVTKAVAPTAAIVGPREGSKLAAVLGLLRRDGGATIDQLATAMGWQPHTTRAALTGLRKRGFGIDRHKAENDRASAYVVGVGRSPARG